MTGVGADMAGLSHGHWSAWGLGVSRAIEAGLHTVIRANGKRREQSHENTWQLFEAKLLGETKRGFACAILKLGSAMPPLRALSFLHWD